jgi:hypothetical protein
MAMQGIYDDKQYGASCHHLFLIAYSVNPTFIDTLKFPKARKDGEFFSVRFMAAAFDDRANRGEFYLRFKEKIYCKRIQLAFEDAGARGITWDTFRSYDTANALMRVWETALNANVQLITRGTCHPKLLEQTIQKWISCHPTTPPMMVPAVIIHPESAAPTSDAMGEFDVVKKRRIMDVYDGSDNDDDDPSRLIEFEEFEDATVKALMEGLDIDDKRVRELEVLQQERAMAAAIEKGEPMPMAGGVYIAKNASLDGILKIGATRRHPSNRLYELSRSSPTPFELVAFFPTMTPFNLEKMVHAYYASCRIHNKGAGTEFFKLALAHLSMVTTALNLPAVVLV